MIVIPPIPITSSVLASSTVAEPSAGEVVWNAATSYAVGDVVIRTTTHRKYECQIAGGFGDVGGSYDSAYTDPFPTNGRDTGNSVIGNSFITWLATGTRLGPISA